MNVKNINVIYVKDYFIERKNAKCIQSNKKNLVQDIQRKIQGPSNFIYKRKCYFYEKKIIKFAHHPHPISELNMQITSVKDEIKTFHSKILEKEQELKKILENMKILVETKSFEDDNEDLEEMSKFMEFIKMSGLDEKKSKWSFFILVALEQYY